MLNNRLMSLRKNKSTQGTGSVSAQKKTEKSVVFNSDLRSIFEAHNFLINNGIDTLILDPLQKVLAHFDPLSIGALSKHHGGHNRFSRHNQPRIDLNRSAWAHNDNASVFTGHFQVKAQIRVGQHFQDHVKAFAIGRFLHMTKPTVNSQKKLKDTRTWITTKLKIISKNTIAKKVRKTNRDKILRQNHEQKISRNHQTTIHQATLRKIQQKSQTEYE